MLQLFYPIFITLILIFECCNTKKGLNDHLYGNSGAGNIFLESCIIDSDDVKAPKGIYNEQNFCYIISLMQAIAPLRPLYDAFGEYKSTDPVAAQCYYIISRIRSGQVVNKYNIRKLINILGKEGWLEEHERRRKPNEPRDPSFLIKFLLDRMASKYLKLMSIIKDSRSNSKSTSYCIDEGNRYDNIEISCSVNKFKTKNPNILVAVSVYDDSDLKHSITYKTVNLVIPKEHAGTKEDVKYNAIGFIQVKPNGNGTNHATAFVKRRDNTTGVIRWYYCNDNRIVKIKEQFIENIIKSECTLLVFYERNCS